MLEIPDSSRNFPAPRAVQPSYGTSDPYASHSQPASYASDLYASRQPPASYASYPYTVRPQPASYASDTYVTNSYSRPVPLSHPLDPYAGRPPPPNYRRPSPLPGAHFTSDPYAPGTGTPGHDAQKDPLPQNQGETVHADE